MVAITFPDGSVRQFEAGVSGAEVASAIGPGLAKAALAVRIDGVLKDLAATVENDARVEIVTAKDADALELIRHDAAHAMAQAVKELYPETQVTIGPAIADGFYYDFARETPFTPEDLERIEARMRGIVAATSPSAAKSGPGTRPSPSSRRRASTTRPKSSRISRRKRKSASTAKGISSISAVAPICQRQANWARPSS